MKKGIYFVLLLILFIGLVGCGSKPTPTPTPTPKEEEPEEPKIKGKISNIEYVLNGGSFSDTDEVLYEYEEGTEYVFPIPSKERFRFVGWADLFTEVPMTMITKDQKGDVVINALWESIPQPITYHTDGGILPETAPYEYLEGAAGILATPKKEGYLFRGWYSDETFQTSVDSNLAKHQGPIEVYAKWQEFSMANIKFGVFGDSISTYYEKGDKNSSLFGGDNQFYYPRYCPSVTSSSMCWWMKAINSLGSTLLVNNSYSGGTVQGTGMSAAVDSQRILKFTVENPTTHAKESPDITFVMLGMNDAIGGNPKATFKSTYKTMLEKLMTYYPSMQLFLCLIPYETYTDGKMRVIYNEAITELAEEFDLPIVDFTVCWDGTTEIKNNWYYLHDNIHPNELGMIEMGKVAAATVREYYHLDK